MDAVEFFKENNRMCQTYVKENSQGYSICDLINTGKYKEAVEIVEKWSKEHPKITNAMKFKEVFGFNIKRSTPSGEYLYMPENWLDQEYKPQEKNADE